MASVEMRAIPGTEHFPREQPPWWKRFGVAAWHDYDSFLFWRMNWSNFTLIEVSGEIEWCVSNAEFELALLGLHVRLTYYWPSEERDALNRAARLVQSGIVESYPMDFDPPEAS